MTKTEAREWVKRIRQNARMLDAAIRAGDEAAIGEVSLDTVGAAILLAQAFDKSEGPR